MIFVGHLVGVPARLTTAGDIRRIAVCQVASSLVAPEAVAEVAALDLDALQALVDGREFLHHPLPGGGRLRHAPIA